MALSNNLNSSQWRNAHVLLGAAQAFGATPREQKALLEAGIAETNLRNLPYGDADSVGILQQRPSQGWHGLMNMQSAAREFLQHARSLHGFQGSAGGLAQAVQGSRYPKRYDQQAGLADALLRDPASAVGQNAPGGAGSRSVTVAVPGQQQGSSFDPGGGTDNTGLISALLQQQQAPAYAPSAQVPAYSAARYLKSAGNTPQIVPQAPQTSSADLLGLLGQADFSLPQDQQTQGQGVTVTGKIPGAPQQPHTRTPSGSIQVAANANRAGVGLTPGIEKLVRQVSGYVGHPLTIGTGTNHNRMTVDGNVSDHWSGNAADLPTTPGTQNIQLGRAALAALGVPKAQAQRAQGGIYNIPYGQHRRIQVIFNTNEGGNHHNHVHVGVTGL